MPEILEFETRKGDSPFGTWFWRLDATAAVRVRRAMLKLERGLRPNVEAVGRGVFEAKISFGPGYRIYFGLDGGELIVLLGGGDKRTQSEDIARAQALWEQYDIRKKEERHGANP